MYDASRRGRLGRPITDGDFVISVVLRVVIKCKGKGGKGRTQGGKRDAGIRAGYSSSRKIQDTIYPVEVRYEAITGHVAQ